MGGRRAFSVKKRFEQAEVFVLIDRQYFDRYHAAQAAMFPP